MQKKCKSELDVNDSWAFKKKCLKNQLSQTNRPKSLIFNLCICVTAA